MLHIPTLETERLLLRPASLRLAKAALDYYTRNEAWLQTVEPMHGADFCTLALQRELQRQDHAAARKGESIRFWMFRKAAPETAIGCVALNNIIYGGFRSSFLAYKTDQSLLRQGYTSEAVCAVIRFAFEGLGLHRIEANILPRNAASLALARKCGFREEGLARHYLEINGVWEDHLHMVLLNEPETADLR